MSRKPGGTSTGDLRVDSCHALWTTAQGRHKPAKPNMGGTAAPPYLTLKRNTLQNNKSMGLPLLQAAVEMG